MEIIYEQLGTITIGGGIAIVAILFYKSGLLNSFADKIKSNILFNKGEVSDRVTKIENNDLKHIEIDINEMRKDISWLRDKVNQNSTDIAVIKVKINGK